MARERFENKKTLEKGVGHIPEEEASRAVEWCVVALRDV